MLVFRVLNDPLSDSKTPSYSKELKEWKEKHAKAKADLGLSRSVEQLEYVQGTESAFYMWTEVISLFQWRALLNRLTPRHRLYSARMSYWERALV